MLINYDDSGLIGQLNSDQVNCLNGKTVNLLDRVSLNLEVYCLSTFSSIDFLLLQRFTAEADMPRERVLCKFCTHRYKYGHWVSEWSLRRHYAAYRERAREQNVREDINSDADRAFQDSSLAASPHAEINEVSDCSN